LENLFINFIQEYLTEKELSWVESRPKASLPQAFVATPRFIRKDFVNVSSLYQLSETPVSREVFWPLDRLVRVYFLLRLDTTDREAYFSLMDTLFETSEMNEAVALYTSLPFLPFPDHWFFRATEAVRSNIGIVFDALAFENPYPAANFTEAAWNQMVLKCIFNDKSIHRIEGLNQRANHALAISISNLAHERWSAGRTIPALVWQLTIPFPDDQIIADIKRLWKSDNPDDRTAAALVTRETSSQELKSLQNESETFIEASWAALEK
jgi:hypothetical protein